MVGGWAYHVVVCGGFAHGVSTLSCLQAVHEVCVDRGSLWCYRVRCEVQGGGALVGLVTPLFLFLALWGRPRADPAVGHSYRESPDVRASPTWGRPCVERALLWTGVPDIALSPAS